MIAEEPNEFSYSEELNELSDFKNNELGTHETVEEVEETELK